MSDTVFKHTSVTAVTMVAFALIGTALLAYVFNITREPIEKSEAEARLALFRQILPDEHYYGNANSKDDDSLLKNVVEIAPNDLLGNKTPSKAYIAKQDHKFAAVILEAIAHDGYSGDIKLLIAIRADGTVSGVRVLAHKETPGLGDYIDIAHGNWIKLFDHESVEKTPAEQWKVKKDGGKFDYMVGATITPRAVVKAVAKALQFYEQNRHVLQQEQQPSSEPSSGHKD
ncbi:electron transport complex subunit RsxG [Methylotenera sp. G11]|uniref:electron transport complex subunit RsxG n=1 Tax=Methylotenera sp. G11 TaxID=1506585 RepID=UPI00064675BB|nr:electron transport complex subunit RsxG [Methylotenera sp. G11]